VSSIETSLFYPLLTLLAHGAEPYAGPAMPPGDTQGLRGAAATALSILPSLWDALEAPLWVLLAGASVPLVPLAN
jgi:hypothetical protein